MPEFAVTIESEPFPGRTRSTIAWYRVTGDSLPAPVHVRLASAANGLLACTALVLDKTDEPITTADLRDIPLSRILDAVAALVAPGPDDPVYSLIETSRAPWIVAGATPVIAADRPRRGGQSPERSKLEAFADTYRAALRDPSTRRRPLSAAASLMHISVPTASRWKTRAIAKGFLEPEDKRGLGSEGLQQLDESVEADMKPRRDAVRAEQAKIKALIEGEDQSWRFKPLH